MHWALDTVRRYDAVLTDFRDCVDDQLYDASGQGRIVVIRHEDPFAAQFVIGFQCSTELRSLICFSR
jgi:hypothetical protein